MKTIEQTQCKNCGNDFDSEELENPFLDSDEQPICDDCYDDIYQLTCPICEDHYLKPEKPIDTFFVVSKNAAVEMEIKPGFYQVLEYPYYLASTFGFENLFENSVRLIRECDINGMLSKIYRKQSVNKIGADNCCPDCVDRYTNLSYRRIDYCNPKVKLHYNIYQRGVIADGK